MGDRHVPELVAAEDKPALRQFLAWHALASEFMCGVVARGIPLAPNRKRRLALMQQIRTENAQASWLVKRVAELGGEVPEQDAALSSLQRDLAPLCDRSWLEYLACAQVAMRGYMGPYVDAMGDLFEIDQEYEAFSREVLLPKVSSQFRRALRDLVDELANRPEAERRTALEAARATEQQAFEIFQRFIATSFPMLEELGVDVAALEAELVAERERLWDRLAEEVDSAA